MANEPLKYGCYYHIYNRGNNRENLFVERRNTPVRPSYESAARCGFRLARRSPAVCRGAFERGGYAVDCAFGRR